MFQTADRIYFLSMGEVEVNGAVIFLHDGVNLFNMAYKGFELRKYSYMYVYKENLI